MSSAHSLGALPRREGEAVPFRTLAAALHRAVTGLARPLADEASGAVQRLVRALLETAAVRDRSEALLAGEQVLAASPEDLAVRAEAFAALLSADLSTRTPSAEQVVLLVEDDGLFAATLQATLAAPGRRIEIVGTAADARKRLAGEPPALVILDLILPDSDGRNILLELRSDPRTAALPLFVVSAKLGSQTKAECFALGADAYFEKPLDLQAFAVAVSARLERQTEQVLMARKDSVTGLANRAAFLESTSQLRTRLAPGAPGAVAVIDLDHFRWVEETWGRQFADSVLRRAGIRLAMELRQAACFARWDGAEFIAFFAGRTAGETGELVEEALEALRRVDFRHGRNEPLTLTFSAGVVDATPDQSLDDLIAAADRMCYAAKAAGRSRVVTGRSDTAVPARKVMLVDDDVDIRRLLARHLRREGFDVVACEDGAQALAAFPDSGAVMVISDVEMPNLDGLGLLAGLRRHPAGRHVPIMMLTAMGDENYIVRAFELGADDYVLKPFSAREVAARMRRLLRRPSVVGVPTQS
jgi:diguanylate cyclase (GGDEF)-like protein